MSRHAISTDTELLVVGAGPAGMAAAATAATHGRQALLLDDNLAPGGQIWREDTTPRQEESDNVKRKTLLALRVSGARVFSGWSVFDAPRPGVLRATCDNGTDTHTTDISYERLIVATGARERFLPFPGWTLPRVFGAGGLQALARGGYSVTGKRIVVAGSGPLLLPVAAHLRQMGARVTTVAEQASRKQLARFSAFLSRQPGKLIEGLQYRAAAGGSTYRAGCWPLAALGTEKLEAVRLTDGQRTWDEPCDLLACGFHLVPNTELAALLGCALRDGFIEVDDMQQTSVANVFAAGEPTGIAGLESALLTGTIAGLAAAGKLDEAKALLSRRQKLERFAAQLKSAFALRAELLSLAQPDTIVCRCEDVTFEALKTYNSWSEAKRQTRCGMGACQGRVCGPAAEAIFGWRVCSVRPPLFPVPLSAMGAGPHPPSPNQTSTEPLSTEPLSTGQ
ncbi:MAG TPA: FAD/NAD(P)-binding oxidoreductase [Acidobacteriaceae bacterium]|nr:FAD/NAD(P)-binding oxidoreductase [Acidobacteriaceae bacterium]